MENLNVKRVYEKAAKDDGNRILVDRLWPRGVKKEEAQIVFWAKEFAPPKELVMWFHEDKKKNFKMFEKKYEKYLQKQKDVYLDLVNKKEKTTLITAVKDIDHSHIPALVTFLKKQYN